MRYFVFLFGVLFSIEVLAVDCSDAAKAEQANGLFKKALMVDIINGRDFYNAFVARDYDGLEKRIDHIVLGSDKNLPVLEDAVSFSYKELAKLASLPDLESKVIPVLNEWVDKKKSANAYSIRGLFYVELASIKRGYGYRSETSDTQLKEMKALGVLAVSDLNQAIKLNPKNSASYESLISIAMYLGDDELIDLTYSQAERNLPGNYWVKHQYLMHLEPKWGGSLEQMDHYALSILPKATANPRLYSLRGDVSAQQGIQSIRMKDYDSAIKYLDKAVACGFKLFWLKNLAYAWYKKGDYDRAITNLKIVSEYDPKKAAAANAIGALKAMKDNPNEGWGELGKSVFDI